MSKAWPVIPVRQLFRRIIEIMAEIKGVLAGAGK
jgi:hypothetical protein